VGGWKRGCACCCPRGACGFDAPVCPPPVRVCPPAASPQMSRRASSWPCPDAFLRSLAPYSLPPALCRALRSSAERAALKEERTRPLDQWLLRLLHVASGLSHPYLLLCRHRGLLRTRSRVRSGTRSLVCTHPRSHYARAHARAHGCSLAGPRRRVGSSISDASDASDLICAMPYQMHLIHDRMQHRT